MVAPWELGVGTSNLLDERALVWRYVSPACAQFCLLEAAHDQLHLFDQKVRAVVKNNFYMDDCLFSVSSVEEARKMVHNVTKLLVNRGFDLRKWLANKAEVLITLPAEKLSDPALRIKSGQTQVCERILDLHWNCSEDHFQFEWQLEKKPCTRRGILLVLSSIFDPLGFLAVLTAKLLLQDLCRNKLSWDDPVSEDDELTWTRWLGSLESVRDVKIPRCFIMPEMKFTSLLQRQLHHFADASSRLTV